MKRFLFAALLVLSFTELMGQEVEMIRHQVQIGETVKMLSRKYRVEPAEIYRLNKFAVDGISQGMTLQILVPKKNRPKVSEEILQDDPAANAETQRESTTHKVEDKETLYSISRKYEVPVEELKKANDKKLSKGLQSGMVIVIPAKN